MKAIKVNNKIIAFLDEQDPKMQVLIEKYKLLPQYEIVEVEKCLICGMGWIESGNNKIFNY